MKFNPKTAIGFRVESPAFIPQNTTLSHVSFLPTILPLKQGHTMKSTFTISAVVLVHVAGIALIVGNGCHTESGYEDKYADNTAIYSGRNAGAIAPAPAPAEARVTPVNGGETTAPVETTLPPPPPPVNEPLPPPVAPSPVPVQPAGEPYIVKNGDTISAIAKRHGVSQKALLKANNLNINSVIKPKQKLIIPPKSAASSAATAPDVSTADGGAFHVVKRGETLSHIALRHKTTVSKLMALNGLSNPNIREGKKLRVPASAASAPVEQPPSVFSDPLATPPPVGAEGAPDLFPVNPPSDAGLPPPPSSVTATPEPVPNEAVPAPAPGVAF
jgi:LysM repeat protein